MTGTGPGTDGGKGNGVEACPLPDEGSVDARAAPWLLRQKIAIPDRVAGYFDRAALVDRAMPTRRRLTAVVAPGGFGKTTLLGECCRRAREDGIPVAWVSVDEQDEPAVLDTYVACACRSAAAVYARAGPGHRPRGSRDRGWARRRDRAPRSVGSPLMDMRQA